MNHRTKKPCRSESVSAPRGVARQAMQLWLTKNASYCYSPVFLQKYEEPLANAFVRASQKLNIDKIVTQQWLYKIAL